jgi:uncharacterized membrane protein YeaQ/YmgE (transglycosylase-associated protein family)
MGSLAWIVVGLITGWLAGQVMKGGSCSYGVLVDIILDILGATLVRYPKCTAKNNISSLILACEGT